MWKCSAGLYGLLARILGCKITGLEFTREHKNVYCNKKLVQMYNTSV